ncbi:hypothetical protein T02_12289, partial [Trichinella nativa]
LKTNIEAKHLICVLSIIIFGIIFEKKIFLINTERA